ncbi:MAG TPA: hypothetical protein VLF71_01735 [Candidatus Saccharimonadales bacterium]|nr:hypothetical protein [Candidatus Saccharimonadales bacterium]
MKELDGAGSLGSLSEVLRVASVRSTLKSAGAFCIAAACAVGEGFAARQEAFSPNSVAEGAMLVAGVGIGFALGAAGVFLDQAARKRADYELMATGFAGYNHPDTPAELHPAQTAVAEVIIIAPMRPLPAAQQAQLPPAA